MFQDLGDRLYSGEKSFNFIGKWRLWYAISAVAVIIAIGALVFRGLTLGIEFKGGAEFVLPASQTSVTEARAIAAEIGFPTAIVVEVGQDRLQIQTPAMSTEESLKVASDLATQFDINENDIAVRSVGPSWGADITRQAVISLGVFLFLVIVFLSIYFDWRMAFASIVALFHDVILTIGVYAIFGIKVTPATVIGVITVLSYSLYDTVVVFDKVRENTRGILQQSRYTYDEALNLAVNQSLIRSINTSASTMFPILAILIVGAGIFSAGTLVDLALALAVGVVVGTYSSIFIAPCVLAQLKDRQPAIIALNRRIAARRAAREGATAVAASAPSEATSAPRPRTSRSRSKRKKK